MKGNHQDRSSLSDAIRKGGPYLNLGFSLAVPIALGAWLGHWLDEKWNTAPWLTLLGCILGMGIGFYNFFKIVMRKP